MQVQLKLAQLGEEEEEEDVPHCAVQIGDAGATAAGIAGDALK